MKELINVLDVDKDKCVNCHSCITACPVKFCNDGSGSYVTVNPNLCLACGSCIDACTHEARRYIDDFNQMFEELTANVPMIAIVAPSAASNFPDKYLNLNGWLKSLGIKAIFDVSFGAELTIKSYIEFIKNNKPKTVIAQPCPALVTYIQIYKPELIKYLAPVDSPMLHTIKMIKHFYTEYTNCKIVIISPCNAKKHEFAETGFGDFNIAYKSIDKYFKENNDDLANYQPVLYDNPPAERAVTFSTPGGLLQTAERWIPSIKYKTRKIEGGHVIYKYLSELKSIIDSGKAPLLVDCLNCDYGCNAGPLTLNRQTHPDEIEYWINKRNIEVQDFYRNQHDTEEKTFQSIENIINKYWNPDIYSRSYADLSENYTLKTPEEQEQQEIFRKMHKYTKNDLYNCTACGYGSCEQMAYAIFNGLNRFENCHFYLAKQEEIQKKEIERKQRRLKTIFETSLDGFIVVNTEMIIEETNPSFLRMLKTENVIGKSLFEFLDSENKNILNEQLKLRQQKINSVYEISLSDIYGTKIECLVSGSILQNDEGERIGSFAMLSDITPLKNAQKELQIINEDLEQRVVSRTAELNETLEELKTSNEVIRNTNKELEKLSQVISKTNNAAFIFDKEGNLEWVNTAFTNIYGYTLEQFITQHGKNIIQLSSNQEIQKIFDDCLKNKKYVSYENEITNKEGDKRWVQTGITPIIDEQDEISSFIAIDTDITTIKQAEEKINKQKAILEKQQKKILESNKILEEHVHALVESERKLNQIIDLLPDATFVIDENKRVIHWNKAIEDLTGVMASEIMGKDNFAYAMPFYGERRPILIDLVEKTDQELKENYTSVKRNGKILMAETYVPKLNGIERYLIGTACLLTNSANKIIGAIEIVRDITDRKKIQEELEAFNATLLEQQDIISRKNLELDEMVEQLKVNTEIIQATNDELETQKAELETSNQLLVLQKREILEKNEELHQQREEMVAINEMLEENQSRIERINKELEMQNAELEAQKEEILSQRDELQKQRDIATSQRDMIAEQQKEIMDSIMYAKRIQTAILPTNSIFYEFVSDFFVLFKPRDIVSGDFYWSRKTDDILIIAAADCTGHGVPGAFMSMLGFASLNETANKFENSGKKLQANEFLNTLRISIYDALNQENSHIITKDGMDIALCIINKKEHSIQFAGAYNSMILFRNNESIEFKADKMPIGAYLGKIKPFTNHFAELKKDDVFYIFTDGYSDQFGGALGRKFLIKRFREVLQKIHKLPMDRQKIVLEYNIQSWKGNETQTDDILVIGFKY